VICSAWSPEPIHAVQDTWSAPTILRAAAQRAPAAAEPATARTLAILAALLVAPVLADGTAVAMRVPLLMENVAMADTTVALASIAASTMAKRCAALRLVVQESRTLGVWEVRSQLLLP
jgi:hypothetical protein